VKTSWRGKNSRRRADEGSFPLAIGRDFAAIGHDIDDFLKRLISTGSLVSMVSL